MENLFTHRANTPLSQDDLIRLNYTEWLVTNSLGGYATGTLGGTLTRVFHGYLIAVLPSPLGRTMMLNDIFETVICENEEQFELNGVRTETNDYSGATQFLTNFRLDAGLPVWTYEVAGVMLEKRIYLPNRQNTTYINYRLIGGKRRVRLKLRPAVNMRGHEAPVNSPIDTYTLTIREHHYELKPPSDIPPLRLKLIGEDPAFSMDSQTISNVIYEIERSRGYTWRGDLWSPGYFSAEVTAGSSLTLVASAETWNVLAALTPKEAWDAEHDRKKRMLLESHPGTGDETGRELVWAADQFVFAPVGRQADTARARAAGDEIRSVIAGYHWFTDWGRDTMISLEGLTLTTGRNVQASYILRTFAHYIRDGLIPNMFPEGKNDGLYNTADATLWFFHALHRYMERTGDQHLLHQLLPKLMDIVEHHLRGTRFNIHVDPADGLLVQGQEGYQLTWMDAKVGDWVVTPRRGKAVEINALWYNALKILEGWLREKRKREEANRIAQHARKARESFNRRFWYRKGGYLYDVVDSENGRDDCSCRPNQVFALSLEHPILDESRWKPVVHVVKDRLLTPVGLRSLAPGEPDYQPTYDGDLRSRDAAYHQGTVWAWLIGPFVDAWLKVHEGDLKTAREFLEGFRPHLRQACVGSISEIFDAEPPFTPRGCFAQAWSVAEVLRSLVKTSGVGESIQPREEMAEVVN